MGRPWLLLAGSIVALGCGGGGAAKGATGTGGASSTTSTSSTSSGSSGGSAASSSGGTGGSSPLECQTSPCINVTNHCPFPLWIHAADGNGVTLMPDDAKLAPIHANGDTQQYAVPASWPSARVNAFWVDPKGAAPDPTAYEKVEVTVGGGKMSYDITYVDYAALPSRIEAVGAACAKTATFDPAVQCPVSVIQFLLGCPAELKSGQRCLSAGTFCTDAQNAASPLCHALDAPLATCEQQNPATCGIAQQLGNGTPNAYACSGYFDSQPANCSPPSTTCHQDGNKWCAALNRGMLAQPDSTDASLYYQTAPYNTYAKWVHDTCPGIYAFAYDDYPSGAGQSGFRSCTAERLDITFCPSG